jgi:hypothetical protein
MGFPIAARPGAEPEPPEVARVQQWFAGLNIPSEQQQQQSSLLQELLHTTQSAQKTAASTIATPASTSTSATAVASTVAAAEDKSDAPTASTTTAPSLRAFRVIQAVQGFGKVQALLTLPDGRLLSAGEDSALYVLSPFVSKLLQTL